MSGTGCGPPEEQVVARESPTAAAAVEPIKIPRERVSVAQGELVSDIGTPLRGLLLPVDYGWTLDDFGLIRSIAETTGLNTVHVYLENWSHPTGTMRDAGDALVSLTAQLGLYLVLGIGGGTAAPDHPGNGWFDIEKVRSFWELYAPRYKDSTHVLFEVQNNPEVICAEPMQEATLEMEREAYALIRSLAPDTHIVLFSTIAMPEPNVVSDALERVAGVVDWSNASLAFHADKPCLPLERFEEVLDVTRSFAAPVLISQLPVVGWEPYLVDFERHRVGWLHLNWLGVEPSLPSFTEDTTRAGLAWCPDRGAFPMPAGECRGP